MTSTGLAVVLLLRPTERISEGKLSPPSLSAVTLKLTTSSVGMVVVKVGLRTTVPLSKSPSPMRLYTTKRWASAVGSSESRSACHVSTTCPFLLNAVAK